MTSSGSWLDRITDTYVDLGLTSLLVVVSAIVVGLIVNHVYFRWRLEPAVTNGISPRLVKMEAIAIGLAVAALIAGLSGWGFAWIGIAFALAFIFALMSRNYKLLAAILLVLCLAILATIMGLKLNAL